MKRNWLPIFLVSGILLLLSGLAAVQYHSQIQVSDADREKMRKRVEIDTNRFAEDFNREIQAIYLNLQTDADAWKRNDFTEFNARYEYWRSKTQYPDLVREIYFIPTEQGAMALRYDAQSKTFVGSEQPPEVRELRERLGAEKDVRPAYEDVCALAIPVHEDTEHLQRVIVNEQNGAEVPGATHMPEVYGHLALLLDRNVITGRLIPDLDAKYFGDGEYKVAVVGENGEQVYGSTTASDSTAALFDLSPDKFIMFAGRDAMTGAAGIRSRNMVFNQKVETISRSTVARGEPGKEMVRVEVQGDASKPRTQILTSVRQPEGGWQLNVQHNYGSIGAFIDARFRRNAAIGAGVFALLAVAILGIFLSSQRARAYAQRQLDFVSSVSHEFRTPLAVICSAGENLADGVTSDTKQVERYGDLIKGEAKKLSAMVEQILEFAGARSGMEKYHFEPTPVADIVTDAVGECGPLLRSQDFEIVTDVPNEMSSVVVDKLALSRALQNLIANSVKYSNGSRWIRISASNGGGNVRIVVEDRGVGIGPADRKHIFEPFYRSKEVVDAQIHGNGLGLSLVKRIAEAHGGRVLVESEVGKGSTFTIELPVPHNG